MVRKGAARDPLAASLPDGDTNTAAGAAATAAANSASIKQTCAMAQWECTRENQRKFININTRYGKLERKEIDRLFLSLSLSFSLDYLTLSHSLTLYLLTCPLYPHTLTLLSPSL